MADDEKAEMARKIAEAKKRAAAKKAAAKKEEPWPFPPTYKEPTRTEDLDRLKERFGDKIIKTGDMSGKPVAYVAPDAALAVLQHAREELDFDHLPFVSAADYPDEDILEVHWQLYSYPRDGRGGKDLAIKVHVPRDDPVVPTVVPFWSGAEWHEREAFDMFGIRFDGHKDLRRIFMPDGWRGHPLRKDYDRKEQYIGLSETGEDVVYDTPGPYRW
jgi:NADH-quinone oxidoreductase subunit C